MNGDVGVMLPGTSSRLVTALRGLPVDRPPFWFMRQAGRYLPEYRSVRAKHDGFLHLCFSPRAATEITLQPIRRFAMDAAILFSDILVVPLGLGQPVRFVEGEGPRLDPVTDMAALNGLRSELDLDRLAPCYETVERVRSLLTPDTALIGFAGAPWTVACYMVQGQGAAGFPALRQRVFADRAFVDALIDRLTAATIAHLSAQIRAGANAVQFFDTWAGATTEPDFRRYVIDPAVKITQAIKAEWPDIPVIGFPRGAGALMVDYADAVECDAVGVDWAAPVGWVRDTIQPKRVVQGAVDPLAVVAGGSALDQEVDRHLQAFGRDRYVFNLGHGLVPQTPPENVARIANRVRAFRA